MTFPIIGKNREKVSNWRQAEKGCRLLIEVLLLAACCALFRLYAGSQWQYTLSFIKDLWMTLCPYP